jgi:hypothetical protein
VYSPSTPAISPINKNDKTTIWKLSSNFPLAVDSPSLTATTVGPNLLNLPIDTDLHLSQEEIVSNAEVTQYSIENRHSYILKEGNEFFYVAYNEDGEFDPSNVDFILQGMLSLSILIDRVRRIFRHFNTYPITFKRRT